MQKGKFNLIIDQAWGSSGKGKVAAWLSDNFGCKYISSANLPNAGHTAVFDDFKFVAKAIPTAAALRRANGIGMQCFISPGSGFQWKQFIKEWLESGRPEMFVHDRALIVTDEHKRRESDGQDSTKHIASTMQGSGAALADKVLRKKDCLLVGSATIAEVAQIFTKELGEYASEFSTKINILNGMEFRNMTHNIIENGHQWLHEGSQGYALSIDHGSHFPNCTSRNCSTQAAMDYMAIPPTMVGDVYLNLRSYPIRVGHVIENGIQTGSSGGWYSDCEELTWEEVAKRSGMPPEEANQLAERERTTVTKRIRRVSTFSFIGLKDAVRSNGVTKLALNFIQYLNWKDAGLQGGKEAFERLSNESREFIDKVEKIANLPVVLIGTGANHRQMISRF
jgi:adenylosuccinate synthase